MNALRELQIIYRRRWAMGRVAFALIVLGVTTLACVGIRSDSQSGPRRVAVARHLPTLTRTPLPTLTPTANVTPVAVALSTESTAPIPEPTSSPVEPERPVALVAPVAPGTEPILPDNSANGAPAAGTEPAVIDPNAPAAVAAVPSTGPPTMIATTSTTEVPPSPTETAIPIDTATPTPTEGPTPTDTPTSTPTAPPLPEGWVFKGVRVTSAESLEIEGLLFFGDLINNTGTAQNLTYINSTYYDGSGQKIPYAATIYQLPIKGIPQGGEVPFELIAEDLTNMADFDLEVVAEPADNPPRQDFEFLEVTSAIEGSDYCVSGHLGNPGGPLGDYLMIAAVLYDSQDQVLNYYNSPYYHSAENSIQSLVGDQRMDFRVCVDPLGQEVTRYELRAWGQ